MGVEDVAVASRIYRLAKERGVGTPLCFWED
jgi:ornithine cyclodeaminase/alanine dehydrogenase-like protein (mu-crystallin family)